MKHTALPTRILAVFTAALLLITSLPLAAFADDGRLGEQLYAVSRPITQSASLTKQTLQGDYAQTPTLLTYSPGGDTRPVAAYGNRLYGKSTIATIADFVADSGRTVFFSTHVLDVAERLCDEIGIIKRGRLIARGTLDELRHGGDSSLEEVFLELVEKKGE